MHAIHAYKHTTYAHTYIHTYTSKSYMVCAFYPCTVQLMQSFEVEKSCSHALLVNGKLL